MEVNISSHETTVWVAFETPGWWWRNVPLSKKGGISQDLTYTSRFSVLKNNVFIYTLNKSLSALNKSNTNNQQPQGSVWRGRSIPGILSAVATQRSHLSKDIVVYLSHLRTLSLAATSWKMKLLFPQFGFFNSATKQCFWVCWGKCVSCKHFLDHISSFQWYWNSPLFPQLF